MASLTLPDIAQLLPHSGRMILLDQVEQADAQQLLASVNIRPDSLFCQANADGAGHSGVGAWVGIEYMAQAIAAWAGYQAHLQGQPASIGFLLGARRYQSHVPAFVVGQALTVSVQMLLQADNGLGSFDCAIRDASTGTELANATVSVFQPHDAQHYLEESKA